MAFGKHYHHFHIILKTVISEQRNFEGARFNEPREVATVYKQCDCGCIDKTEMLVTHLDGRGWE